MRLNKTRHICAMRFHWRCLCLSAAPESDDPRNEDAKMVSGMHAPRPGTNREYDPRRIRHSSCPFGAGNRPGRRRKRSKKEEAYDWGRDRLETKGEEGEGGEMERAIELPRPEPFERKREIYATSQGRRPIPAVVHVGMHMGLPRLYALSLGRMEGDGEGI